MSTLVAAWAFPGWWLAIALQSVFLVRVATDTERARTFAKRALLTAALNVAIAIVSSTVSLLGVTDADALRGLASTGLTPQLAHAAVSRALRGSGRILVAAGALSIFTGGALALGRLRASIWAGAIVTSSLAFALAGSRVSDQPLRADPAHQALETIELDVEVDEAVRRAASVGLAFVPPRVEARFDQVVLVMLESVGRDSVATLVASGEGAFARLARESLYAPTALAPSNVSHVGQPAILVGRDLTRSPANRVHVMVPIQPAIGLADWFHAQGFRTMMISSQMERWLGLDRVIASQRWDVLVHSESPEVAGNVYEDACGTVQLFDSATVDRLIDEASAIERPWFAYVNLQNTHYPYIVEGDPDPLNFEGLDCTSFDVMPPGLLDVARARYERALREAEARVGRILDAFPGALVVVVGDHGEELVDGWRFGHAKTVAIEQIATSLFVRGAGLSPSRIARPVSTLDVFPTIVELTFPGSFAQLPRGLLAGRPLSTAPGRNSREHFFAVAHGFHPEVAVTDGALEYRATPDTVVCRDVSAPVRTLAHERRCAPLASRLGSWLACQSRFGRPDDSFARAHYNPCFEHFR